MANTDHDVRSIALKAIRLPIVNAIADGLTDVSAFIQQSIDDLEDAGGGLLYIPKGTYLINSALTLKSKVLILGDGDGTILSQVGDNAIVQTSATALERAGLKDLRFSYAHAIPLQTHSALKFRSMQYCVFEGLSFTGYNTATSGSPANDGQILCEILPDSTVAGKKNFVFNDARDWSSDGCRIGVWYEGKDNSSVPDPDPTVGTYAVSNAISGNSWYNLSFDNVTDTGIYAKQWADSEKWYSYYCQLAEEGSKCIDLNVDTTNFWQIDRFQFFTPTLVYLDGGVADASTVNGVRLGPGTHRHLFTGIKTDKTWNATKAAPVAGAADTFIDTSSLFISATITNITQANPAVVTATAHGLANTSLVKITGVVGMVEVNDRIFTVANKADDTFELSGEDSTGHTAYGSLGSAEAIEVGSYDITFGSIGEGANVHGGRHFRGLSTVNEGTATIIATGTSVTVTHRIRRAPTGGEIQISPLSNIFTGADRGFWVSSVGATTFQINISTSHATVDFDFGWRVELGQVS